jgi:diguanylate cyclase (GGDEF)-like protein
MSKFLNRHSEGWQCAQDTVFNRLVSDVQANKLKYKQVKASSADFTEEILVEDKFKLYESKLIKDELTGLFNTHYFSEKLPKELQRCKRYKRPFSLMFVSIDRLSQLQKLYGNLLLCQVLQQEAQTLIGSIREVDLAFRVGLDQFVVIFPETYSSKATIVGQRICNRTRSQSINSGTNTVIATVSIGIASFPTHGRQEKELIATAWQLMKTAQKSGGNQVLTS